MICLTKIFRFETAHAIHGYVGPCANIHGHSYELQVSIAAKQAGDTFIGGTGILMDFKELKALVQQAVVSKLDHQLILSKNFLTANNIDQREGIRVVDYEPTAENLLIFMRNEIEAVLPAGLRLSSLKLWETRDSFAEWLPPGALRSVL